METQIRHQAEPRIFFDQPVAIYVADRDRPLHGRALNLSRGGVFVRLNTLLPRTTPVAILFELPDGQLVDAEATVVRLVRPESASEPTGMALCFGQLDPAVEERIEQFIIGRTRPAGGKVVSLHLDQIGYPIKARTHSSWQNMLSVDAELPFLQLGSPVSIPHSDGSNGRIRWVSVHIPPESGIPRINIGIEIARQDYEAEEILELDYQDELDELSDPDEWDPVCTEEFAAHSETLDHTLRGGGATYS